MASRVSSRTRKFTILLILLNFYSIVFTWSSATVILIGNNVKLSFKDIAVNFAPAIRYYGLCGKLYLAEALDACSPLTNKISSSGNWTSLFVLISRNNCSFEEKVRRAQRAGFRTAIVYNNVDDGALVKSDSVGIKIHAVFVSKASGEKLSKYAGQGHIEVCLVPNSEDAAAWSIMAISFIALLAMSALLATCFFVRRHRIRRGQQAQEFHGMSKRLVKAMPSLVFTAALEDNCTAATCAICLDDYTVGDKIRVLPCKHKFHSVCVDCWLTSWRTFCPVCKRDARTSMGIPPASESTPLLSSATSSPVSSSSLRSYSSAVRIASPSPLSCNSPNRFNRPIQLHIASSSMSMTSASHLVSPSSSLGYPSVSPSPLNYRYLPPYEPSPNNMSSSYLASTSRPLHCTDSVASFFSYASAQSLPGC